MRFANTSLTILTLFATSIIGAAATAVPHIIETYAGEKSGRFLVTLKQGVSKESLINQIKQNATVTHEWDIINGFASQLDEHTLNGLRANLDVESIAEDGVMHAMVTQTNAPWGIARLSSTTRLANQNSSDLTFSYTYEEPGGFGVDIYIIDTGVSITHSEFGGRARWGATFGPYADADGNGHGTHCAAVAAGNQFGVAKRANIVAVKVLSDAGSGTIADIVSGLNYVLQQHASSGRPTVACMSLGGSASTALDSAVTQLTNAGVHVSVAAGSEATDAGNTSPARVPSANTVGASSIADSRTSFSNFGSVVDLFAPGQNIIGAWIGSTTATSTLSGTSMANCHVAGLIAYLISVRGNMSPSDMSMLLKDLSIKDVLTGIPSGTLNNLAHNT